MGFETSAVSLYEAAARAEQKYKEQKSDGTGFKNAMSEAVSESGTVSLDAIFEEAAAAYDIPVSLLKAVAKAESNFNPSAVSRAGAIGVMQLMPGTASSLGVTDPYDARQNILGGAKYLKSNLERYDGNVSLALAAYNAGPGSVAKYGGIPPYAETQNYVKKVTSYMNGEELHAGNVPGNTSVLSGYGNLYGASGLSGYGSLYGTSALTGDGSLYGSSMLSGIDGTYGTTASSGLGGLFGSSQSGTDGFYGTAALAGLGNAYGSSALTGTGSLYGMSSIYGSTSDLMNMLFGIALQREEEDSSDIDKDTYYNMIELLRLRMMMDAGSQVGSISI